MNCGMIILAFGSQYAMFVIMIDEEKLQILLCRIVPPNRMEPLNLNNGRVYNLLLSQIVYKTVCHIH